MASDEEPLQSMIAELKEHLRSFGSDYGVEGALLCQTLDEAATQIAFAFPSIEKKVKYANILLAGNESYEYEDDEDDEDEDKTDYNKQVNDKGKDHLVLEKLEEVKWMADAIRFQRLLDYERGRMSKMSLGELHGIVVQVTSFLKEATSLLKEAAAETKKDLDTRV